MAEDGFPPLPTFSPIVKDGDHPFLFVPTANHNFLNSTFSNIQKHVFLEKMPRLHMNVLDADNLGIEDGDKVRIWNDRGECELTAAVGENVLQGVVVSQGLWSNRPDSKQLVNTLTPDRLADMGGGAAFFSGRVSVEKTKRNTGN
jgi:anaerobic selenocysteine-containing dehydrogenase